MLILALLFVAVPILSQETQPKPKVPSPNLKSEKAATFYSALCTLVPLGVCWLAGRPRNWDNAWWWGSVLGFGLIVGPSTGYFYGGLPHRALLGMGIRGLVPLLGLASPNNETWTLVVIAAISASAVFDILSVGGRVHQHNLELQNKTLAVAPVLIPDRKGVGVGLEFRLSF